MIDLQLPQSKTLFPKTAYEWGITSDKVAEVCSDLLALCILEAVADGIRGNPRPVEENAMLYFRENIHKALIARGVSPSLGMPLTPNGLVFVNACIRKALFGTTMTLTEPNEMSAVRKKLIKRPEQREAA